MNTSCRDAKTTLFSTVIIFVVLATFIAALAAAASAATVPTVSATRYSPLGMYRTSIQPDFRTFVVNRPANLAELGPVINELSEPRTIIYFVDVDPAELSSVTPGLDVQVTQWLPSPDNKRVISYLTIQDTGRKVVNCDGFVGRRPDLTEALDIVTTNVNSVGPAQFSEAAMSLPMDPVPAESPSGLDMLLSDPPGPLPQSNAVYNPSTGITTGSVWTQFWMPGNAYVAGQTQTYFTCKWLWNDGRDQWDYVAVHARSNCTPGYLLSPSHPPWLFYDQTLDFRPGTNASDQSYQDLAATRPNSNNAPNNTVSITDIGWSPYPGYLTWQYPFHGQSHYGDPYEVWNQSVGTPPGPTETARWKHEAAFNDTYNEYNVIAIQPGWNQTVKQNQPLKVVLAAGAGAIGSYASWDILFQPDPPSWTQPMDGVEWGIAKPPTP